MAAEATKAVDTKTQPAGPSRYKALMGVSYSAIKRDGDFDNGWRYVALGGTAVISDEEAIDLIERGAIEAVKS